VGVLPVLSGGGLGFIRFAKFRYSFINVPVRDTRLFVTTVFAREFVDVKTRVHFLNDLRRRENKTRVDILGLANFIYAKYVYPKAIRLGFYLLYDSVYRRHRNIIYRRGRGTPTVV